MSRVIIGGILGIAIAFVLDCLGVYYIISILQPYFNVTLSIYHFYGLFGFSSAIAGILTW